MVTRNIIGIGILAAAVICSIGLYSYYSPDIWIKDVRKAAQDGDKERLQDLIDFDSVRTGLKEEVRAQLVTSMDANLKDNPFSALGLAMVSLMVDPIVDMIVSPSGIAALIERGNVRLSNKKTDTSSVPPSKGQSGSESIRLEQGYESISRYRIRMRRVDSPTEEPIVLSLRREGLFSWKLSRIALPSKLLNGAERPQRPSHISIVTSDMQV